MSGLRCLQRPALALTLLAGLALMVAGCRMVAPAPVRENIHSADDLAANEEQMRLRIRALVAPYSGSIVESADRIRLEPPTASFDAKRCCGRSKPYRRCARRSFDRILSSPSATPGC